jgi:hypothetical protein
MLAIELAAVALGYTVAEIKNEIRKSDRYKETLDGIINPEELELFDILEYYPRSILTSSQEFWISVVSETDDDGNLHFSDCEKLFKMKGSNWIDWTLSQSYGTKIRNIGVLKAALGG